MRRALALVVALAALAAVTAVVASAKTVNDPNDTMGKVDIKKATFKKLSAKKFRVVVIFFQDVPPKGEQGNEDVDIWKSKPHQASGCGGCFKEAPYAMQGPQTGKQNVVTNCGAEGDPCNKTGTVTIKRAGKKLTFTFSRKSVGNPKHHLFWRVTGSYYGNSDECPTFNDCYDTAPDNNKLVKESL